jgi:hypothetical protein
VAAPAVRACLLAVRACIVLCSRVLWCYAQASRIFNEMLNSNVKFVRFMDAAQLATKQSVPSIMIAPIQVRRARC